jgi:hypothetical protein
MPEITDYEHSPPRKRVRKFKKLRAFRLDPYRWNKQYCEIIGTIFTYGVQTFLSIPLPAELLAAATSTIYPEALEFLRTFTDNDYRLIASTSYDIFDSRTDYAFMQSRDPGLMQQRQWLALQLVEEVLIQLCPNYKVLEYQLKLKYRQQEVWWDPRGVVSHIWVVEPRRRSPCFSEEAAYAISIAQTLQNQENIREPAIELEFWMISVRGTKIAIIKVVVMVWMLQILGRCHSDVQESVWVNDMKKGGLNMEVSKEYNLYENEERVVFFGLLGGLAKLLER